MHRRPPYRINRRTFLRWSAGALAAIPLAGCAEDDATPFVQRPVDEALFPAGLHAGAMTHDGAIFWTRCADRSPLVLRIWPEAAPDDAQPAVEVDITPAEGGFCAPKVTGLPAGEWWRYAFYDDARGVRSPEARVRTAFAPGVRAPLRVGATACTAYSRNPFPALNLTADAGCDVFCHLGDMVYNDAAYDAARYADDWEKTHRLPGYRAILASTGSYFVWDDHEFFDSADLHAPEVDLARVALGKQAFYDYLAVDVREEPGAGALVDDRVPWRSFRWGDTAEFFLLDSRLERRPQTRGTDDVYLGEKQLEWLLGALSESPCHFKIILNSVPIADLPRGWLIEDRWTEYPTQREALLTHITDGLSNVWFLAGDFHVSAVWRVEASGPRSGLWEILCGPAGSAPSKRLELAESVPQLYFPEGRIDFAQGEHAATWLDFDPDADSVRAVFTRAADGELLYDETLQARPLGEG